MKTFAIFAAGALLGVGLMELAAAGGGGADNPAAKTTQVSGKHHTHACFVMQNGYKICGYFDKVNLKKGEAPKKAQ
jgi:hypothetical protein